MLLRGVRCALAAAVATGSFLLVLPTRGSAGAAGAQLSLVLLGQDPTVTPAAPGDPASFTVTVGMTGTPPGAEIGLSFYSKLHTPSAFEQTLSAPPSDLLDMVAPQPIAALRRVDGGVQLTTTVVVGNTAAPSGSATVNLDCTPGTLLCSGVYPVVVQLFNAAGSVVSHFTTYLTYEETKSATPLVFTWVVPMGSVTQIRTTGSLGEAIPPLNASRAKHLEALGEELATNPGVQVSVAPSPATLERLEHSSAPDAPDALGALHWLQKLAAQSPHRLVAQPYVPINLSQIAAAGISTEIKGQKTRANAIVTLAGLTSAEVPWQTWVATGQVGPAIGGGMHDVGATTLVLPDTDLPPATEEAHATWSQPFSLSLGHGQSVTAAVSNSMLSTYFTSQPNDPVLAANQLLADLAFIQSELPGVSNTRGVIAVPPPSWDPNPHFVEALVAGLSNNPVIATATLSGFFATVQAGVNDAASTRRLPTGTGGSTISSSEAASFVAARNQITGFDAAAQGQPAVVNQLEDLLLTSESDQLSPQRQRAGLAVFEQHLANELGDIQVVKSTVTLTARTATIPITIVSTAAFPVRATLTLSSPKLQFPNGRSRNVLIDHPTNSTQIEVRARTSGDLPLSFTLTSPNDGLVIERGSFTVRSTATSIVGIVLTLAAAVVLIGWWTRTWARGRRVRRARARRGAPA